MSVDLASFFFYGSSFSGVEKAAYRWPLVGLSYLVAGFSSYTALSMAQQLAGAGSRREKTLLHWGGAFAMGAGIWSMHFIGMLSYKMRMVVEYDPALTLLSMLIAIAVAYGVLGIVARRHLSAGQMLLGGVLLGLGICGMHYTGMAAMKMDADLRYVPGIFALSVLIAMAASAAALWMAFNLSRNSGKYRYVFQTGAALIMGAGICGMHYTGMWAAVFMPYANCRYDPAQNFDALALAVAAITGIILSLALGVGVYKGKQADLKIQNSEAKLRAVVEHTLDGLITINARGIVESFNPACERIFGYRAAEVLGHNIKMLMPEPYQGAHDGYISHYLRTGDARIIGTPGRELTARRRNGSTFPIDLSISAFHLGDVQCFSGIIRDITERKKSEAALKEMSRRKDEFLANMSHELRTPLNAVVGIANILSVSDPLTDKQREFVDTLKASADHLLTLINDLLDFAKLEQGAAALEHIDFSLPEVMEKVVSLMNVKAREKNLALDVHYAPGLRPYFVGDPLRLQQVLTNLVSNAVKFTEEGRIEISVEGESDPGGAAMTRLVIRISDTGIGIPEDKVAAIFDKFFQADASITRKYGGSGLGLAICKTLIDKMGGAITVKSQPGLGSVFTLELPLENSVRAPKAGAAASGDLPQASAPAKTVLVVEDYPPNTMVVSTMLDRFGYGHDVAMNGAEALRKCQLRRYDLILMDVQMPEMDGMETTRRIRAMENEKRIPHVPIVAMTAHVRDSDKQDCAAAGMNDFIPKPFEPRDLAQKLAKHLD